MKDPSNKIVTGSFYMLIGITIKTGIDFLTGIITGRVFGPSILGSFSLANTILTLLSIISLFGLDLVLNRHLPLYEKKSQKNVRSKLIGTTIKYTLLISILFTALIYFTAPSIGEVFESDFLSQFLRIIIYGFPAIVLTRLILSITTSIEKAKFQAVVENIFIPLGIVVSLIVGIYLNRRPEVLPYSYLISYLSSFLVSIIIVYKLVLPRIDKKVAITTFDRKVLAIAIPFFLNNLLLYFSTWIDNLLLGYYLKETEVGIYAVAKRIGGLPLIFITALNIVFLPTISKLVHAGKDKLLDTYYEDAVRLLLNITLPLCIFISVFAPQFLSIFGEEFKKGELVLILITIGTFLNIASGPIGKILIVHYKQNYVTLSTLLALIVGALVSIILIPRIGILGAGISYIVSSTLQNYIGVFILYRMKSILPYTRKNLLLLISLTFSTILLVVSKHFTVNIQFASHELVETIFIIVLNFIIFISSSILFILLFKAYEEKDKEILLSIMSKFKVL